MKTSCDSLNPLDTGMGRTAACYEYNLYECQSIGDNRFAIPDSVPRIPSSVPKCTDYLSVLPLESYPEKEAFRFDLVATAKAYEVMVFPLFVAFFSICRLKKKDKNLFFVRFLWIGRIRDVFCRNLRMLLRIFQGF